MTMILLTLILLAQLHTAELYAGETPEPQYSINIQPGQCVKANADYTFTLITCPVVVGVEKQTKRDPHQVVLFKEKNACPSTKKLGNHPCPGWIVNHIKPLACNGPDTPENMEWEEQAASYKRDVWERQICKGK
jgi:hypothetical protein